MSRACRVWATALAFASAASLAACGVGADGSARAISDRDVPFDLLDPTPAETATSAPAPAARTEVFLVRGDRLAATTRDIGPGAGTAEAVGALEGGATNAEAAAGLRSAVPSSGIERVVVDDGVASVDLDGAFTTLDPAEQLLAIAQIVFTATAQPGVDAVRFQLGGRPVEVPTDGASLASRPVTRSDYRRVAPAD